MKLQPNFSWQKYEGEEEDQQQQFQYQLQNQHVQVSNSVNATIDDESFFTTERMTSFTWTDGRPIWKKTYTFVLAVAGANSVPLAINGAIRNLIQIYGSVQNAVPLTTFGLTIPYVDSGVLANGISVFVTPTTLNVNLGAATWQNYIANVTVEFTKV